MEHPDYTIEQMTADNLDDLYRLFESVYHKKQQPGFFHRKYDTAYTGHSHIGYFAYDKNRVPIAFYGVVPCFLSQGHQRTLAAQSTDTMTHPGYRYKGMFMELSQRCFDLCREHGISLLFGFPNQNSYHGALKLGWIMTGTMNYFSVPVGRYSWEDLCSKFQLSNMVYKWYCQRILKKYAGLENGLSNLMIIEGFTGVERNEAYLQYKKYSRTSVLEIGGSKVWVKVKHGMAIGDLHLAQDADFDELIGSLTQICRKLGLKEMSFHSSDGTHLYELFASRYSCRPSFPMLFQDFDASCDLGSIRFTLADIDIF